MTTKLPSRWIARACGALAGLAITLQPATAAAEDKRVVTDSAGRRVEMPTRIERVFAAGPPATIILFTLAPEKLLGWTRPMRGNERDFIPARYADLPTLGRLSGRGGTANIEAVLAARPDLIVDYGAVNPTYVSLADRVQAQSRIPYVLIDAAFEKTAEAYALLGGILGAELRAAELIDYVSKAHAEVGAALASRPAAQGPRVYYARGPKGLETGLDGSINVESLERVGAINVAAEGAGKGGLASVTLEQILLWNPDTIITIDPQFYASVWSDPLWQGIKAVHDRRVFLAPTLPFGWIDFPPSVNRVMGLRWLTMALYPTAAVADLRAETREFYRLFYHQTPSEAQLDALLLAAGGNRR